ncbi:YheC/YheD family protein [Bacillus sp. B15-48]|uniref:YheC/YheD family endospore coat-associated protein n=1 Tax=Bacillus sp. B15-48 TaxID=1548601 RepID=UPI001EF39C72|nr:YheC/YheD family protein [Bacillus sp. B15-48]
MIGMLHDKNHPSNVKKAYACAAVAKMEGIDFFYFTYHNVDFENRKIDGWMYDNGSWEKHPLVFPDVILNISGPKSTFQKEVYRKLKTDIPFTSYSVGNKMNVYKKITKKGVYSPFLIPTFSLKKANDFLSLFDQFGRIVIKPFSGNHGKNVIFVDKLTENEVKVTDGTKQDVLNLSQFELFIEKLKGDQNYLFQPFIDCKTKAGLPYDFRLHVQKNGLGEWEVNLIYPRISGNGKFISNISGGGYRGELLPFLKEEFGNEYFNIKRLLERFALTFAAHLETLYKHSFDELGIDVGIDENHKLWIYEVNWRPGAKHREFEVAKRLVKYAEYLTKRR